MFPFLIGKKKENDVILAISNLFPLDVPSDNEELNNFSYEGDSFPSCSVHTVQVTPPDNDYDRIKPMDQDEKYGLINKPVFWWIISFLLLHNSPYFCGNLDDP